MTIHHTEEELRHRAGIIASEYSGIVPHFEAMYIQSILYPAGRAVEAFQRLAQIEDPGQDSENAVAAAQEAIGHAGAVSRFFWPVDGPRREPSELKELRKRRGEALRSAFDLSDDSPLANRDLRNAWEHFDERLDQYLLGIDAGVMLPGCIVDDHSIADDPNGYTFKVLDPTAECLVLVGTRYFYGAIRDEVHRIYLTALECDRDGDRLLT
ncbi:hypothetical protein TVD_03955 [Thioalkalivibrio versutus]|uniref:Uncharacterized protein n=1 Tax=Thioalkalivibrio versutus TaxID=106634 RepID=A0A0G3G008_9GAMM|nr:hypothetical protein [Thioalkalivibrio versutus]AKJ94575.1 hypothetical protein TVD_03955 [Thioalkalivibrio versutus]